MERKSCANWGIVRHDLDSAARSQIRYGLVLAILAIEKFRWEHGGVLPNDLREVSPGAAVTDPATGQPYAYRLIAGGYEVYSVGTSRLGMVRLSASPIGRDAAPAAEMCRYAAWLYEFVSLGKRVWVQRNGGNSCMMS